MSAAADLRSLYPGAFFLDAGDLESLASYLTREQFLQPEEAVQHAERAGEGNMNSVLRVRTNQRSFILKQSRPWVEKYPGIAAPWDRILLEARFYETVAGDARIAAHMPRLLAFDAVERLMMLEDILDARDFTSVYSGRNDDVAGTKLAELTNFLVALHTSYVDPVWCGIFENLEMRTLNHEHIFSLPLRPDSGLDLDAITPGLASIALDMQRNKAYSRQVAAAGRMYLDRSSGSCLLHGDYFPGSWLQSGKRVFVIDPEFCFYGPPEWDAGVMLAHLHLAGKSGEFVSEILDRYAEAAPLDRKLTFRFAGIEIMRRLIGVAQLPLSYGIERKRELLDLAQRLVLEGDVN